MMAKNKTMRCKASARLCGAFCIPDIKLKAGVSLALWRCDAQSMQKPPAVRPAGGKLVY